MAAPSVAPAGSGLVRCPLCSFEYEPGGTSCREKGCPVALGGCATRHCPRCGYTMPDEERSFAARWVRRLFTSRAAATHGTLARLGAGTHAVIERLEGDPALLARLTAQGLAPGVAIHVVQRAPTHVIELGETMLALETRVAEGIHVRVGAAKADR
jgi:Fe2+ transport system protein FeoA